MTDNIFTIDVYFDFTTDTANYWSDYWNNNNGMGGGKTDPDIYSKTLQTYHKVLWSKRLPNGEYLDLKAGTGAHYLTWKDFRFGSDSITASFRYEKYRYMIEQVQKAIPNYRAFMEQYIHKSYTIGGAIIFPKWHGGINQSRGCNPYIRDRFDLTLDCIRRYYNGQESPLYSVLLKDKAFFDLFVDFKGYIDYFFLQDWVSDDYNTVNFIIGNGEFVINPFPQSVEEYVLWLNKQLELVESRNKRILNAINGSF